jgi:nucleoside-triphosphatase
MPNNLLITGESGIGKSTVLAEVVEFLKPRVISGFVSPRVSDAEADSGWMIEGFNGVGGLIAHASIESEHRMGAFGVDMEMFDRCVAAEAQSLDGADVVVIDEIGIIGSWSDIFMDYVNRAMDEDVPVVTIVRMRPGEFSDQIKSRDDAETRIVTVENRNSISGDIARWVEAFDSPDA